MSLSTNWLRIALNTLIGLIGPRLPSTAVMAKADGLTAVYGDFAYGEARLIARGERAKRRPKEDRFWSQVALEIARRQGREIGVKGADRWFREARAIHAHRYACGEGRDLR
ncbi:hypothetical protein [Methylobacterium sp. 22177]|uniref:hypothetical protein n=1 Tax=Methylobacterium sp. 22177 TaxID=3453885 RepID=UPI003F8750A1